MVTEVCLTLDEFYLFDLALIRFIFDLLYPFGVLLSIRKMRILPVGNLGDRSLGIARYCAEEVLGGGLIRFDAEVYLGVLLRENSCEVELGNAEAFRHCGRGLG